MNRSLMIVLTLICISGCGVNPAERNNEGNTLTELGEYDRALAAYHAAQVASPDSPEAYYNAAIAYAQQGELDKAIQALQQAARTTDSDLRARTYYNLGNVYFQLERFDSAVDAYKNALLINENDDDARYNLELAIKRLVVPSPTPLMPTDEGGGGDTPTPDSEDHAVGVSPTGEMDFSANSLVVTPVGSEPPPTISVDDAESILDAVQQAQPSLPNQLTPSGPTSTKDW